MEGYRDILLDVVNFQRTDDGSWHKTWHQACLTTTALSSILSSDDISGLHNTLAANGTVCALKNAIQNTT
jgi:hypothetical protein